MKSSRTSGPRSRSLVDAWCQEFESACRERGIRITTQRRAVYRALAADLTHPTADALHAGLVRDLPSLSLATVYRILESLEREGFVRRVSSTDGAGRFDANLIPHQHLVCRICGSITDHHADSLDPSVLSPGVPRDFRVEGFDVRVIGVCGPCSRAPARQ